MPTDVQILAFLGAIYFSLLTLCALVAGIIFGVVWFIVETLAILVTNNKGGKKK